MVLHIVQDLSNESFNGAGKCHCFLQFLVNPQQITPQLRMMPFGKALGDSHYQQTQHRYAESR
jgi:hypothetical protein